MRYVKKPSNRKDVIFDARSVDDVATVTSSKRVGTPDYLRGAVKAYNLQMVQVSDVGVGSGSISNGSGATFSARLESLNTTGVLADFEYSLHVDSIAAANAIPLGSSVDENDFQVIPQKNIVDYQNGSFQGLIPENAQLFQLYVGNNSGSTRTFFFQVRVRYILYEANEATGAGL